MGCTCYGDTHKGYTLVRITVALVEGNTTATVICTRVCTLVYFTVALVERNRALAVLCTRVRTVVHINAAFLKGNYNTTRRIYP